MGELVDAYLAYAYPFGGAMLGVGIILWFTRKFREHDDSTTTEER